MTYTSSITEQQVLTIVRAWIIDVLGVPAIQGYTNRVPMPNNGFVLMSGLTKQNLSMNRKSFINPIFPEEIGSSKDEKSIDYSIQIDAYGRNSGDWVNILSTAFSSDRTWSFFTNLNPAISPLYMEDARQSPLVTGEQQYEARWMMIMHVQFNPSISGAQQSAIELEADIINVDVAYPG